MKGDFSRVLEPEFKLDKDERGGSLLSRIRLQQGRPLIDSDINEQFDIIQSQFEEMVRGLMGGRDDSDEGGHGYFGKEMTEHEANFAVCVRNANGAKTLVAKPGTYYVDGMRCVLRKELTLPSKNDGNLYLAELLAVERELTLAEASQHEPAVPELPGVHSKVEFDIEFRTVDIGRWQGTWQNNKGYSRDNVVSHSGKLYKASADVAANQTAPPQDVANWQVFSAPPQKLQRPMETPALTADFVIERNEFLRSELYRVEFHNAFDTTENGTSKKFVRLKLGTDNASHAFKVQGESTKTIRLSANASNTSYLPKQDDWLEVETVFPADPGALLKIDRVLGQGVYELNGSAAGATQVRVWRQVEVPEVKDRKATFLVQEGPIKSVTVNIDPNVNDAFFVDGGVKHTGYHWIIPIRPKRGEPANSGGNKSPNTKEPPVTVIGTQRFGRQASVPLALTLHTKDSPQVIADFRLRFQIVGQPHVPCLPPAAVNGGQPPAEAAAPLTAPAETEQGLTTPGSRYQYAVKSAAGSPPIPLDLLNSTPCRRLFPQAKTAAVNAWLASAEFGEVNQLSRSALRARIARDCASNDYQQHELEQDIDMIVNERTALLAGTRANKTNHLI